MVAGPNNNDDEGEGERSIRIRMPPPPSREAGEGSEASEAVREVDLSHLSRTPADTPPWTPAYSLPPPVAHAPSTQVGAAPPPPRSDSSRIYVNPRALPPVKRPAKLSPRKAPRHHIDWGSSPPTSDAARATLPERAPVSPSTPPKWPPTPPPSSPLTSRPPPHRHQPLYVAAAEPPPLQNDADADADARVAEAALLTPPSTPPLLVAHPHARRVETGRRKQSMESRA